MASSDDDDDGDKVAEVAEAAERINQPSIVINLLQSSPKVRAPKKKSTVTKKVPTPPTGLRRSVRRRVMNPKFIDPNWD